MDQIFEHVHESTSETLETTSKSWNKYYSDLYRFSVSPEYEKMVEECIGRKPKTEDFVLCRTIFDKVSSTKLQDKTTNLEETQAKKLAEKSVQDSESAFVKIRYIGGACIAKSRFHFVKSTRSSLYKDQDKTSKSFLKVKMMDHLTCSDDQLLLSSKYPQSLHETKRKQNISSGLTNIADETFDFFF